MRLWIKILLTLIAIYAAGILTGFFIAPSYQNQTKLIGQTASIIQYPTIIGVAVAMWRTIADWYRENVLEYDGIFVKKQHHKLGSKDIYRLAYYLRKEEERTRKSGEL